MDRLFILHQLSRGNKPHEQDVYALQPLAKERTNCAFYGVHRAIHADISYDNMRFLTAAENAGGWSEFLLYNG